MTLHQRREFFGYTYIPGRSGRSRCSARPVRRRCWLTRRRRRRRWRNTACRGWGGGCGSAWAGGWRRTCVGKAVSQERLTTEAQRHRDQAVVRFVRCPGRITVRSAPSCCFSVSLCLCAYYENTPRVGTLAGAASTYYAAFAVIWTSYPMARSRFVRLMAVR